MANAAVEIREALLWLRGQRLRGDDWASVDGHLAALTTARAANDEVAVLRIAYEIDRLTKRVKTRLGDDPDDGRHEIPAALLEKANEHIDSLVGDPDDK